MVNEFAAPVDAEVPTTQPTEQQSSGTYRETVAPACGGDDADSRIEHTSRARRIPRVNFPRTRPMAETVGMGATPVKTVTTATELTVFVYRAEPVGTTATVSTWVPVSRVTTNAYE